MTAEETPMILSQKQAISVPTTKQQIAIKEKEKQKLGVNHKFYQRGRRGSDDLQAENKVRCFELWRDPRVEIIIC